MPQRRRQRSRVEERAQTRKQVAQHVKPWPMGLETNLPRLTRMVADEWNFEKFYDEVRRFAGSGLTRETLQEFLRAKGLALKSRPQASAKLV
jgi:hypothetical protein